MGRTLNRREAVKGLTLGAGILGMGTASYASSGKVDNSSIKENASAMNIELKGNINHSVCRWCYNDIPLEKLAEESKAMGLKSIEILGPADWPVVQKYGLTCAIATDSFASIADGFNDPANHGHLQKSYKKLISQAADAGLPQVICFSGNRKGMDDQVGLENCAVGLEPLVKHAEKNNITLIMELLNSKVNHKDYMCDKTPWGVELVEKIGSPNFKLLYDIYHMQIMEGDIIASIRKYHKYISHYHTGGVPGRNEINDSQELNYPAIMKAILETGYKGYVAQEFIPTWDDQLAALKEGVMICDV
ncbi:MAG: TIM barrel protein [Cyclobacteriaceae bacterium]|nr:TIM barrel protein [Cyclobacteriaceae bacterium]